MCDKSMMYNTEIRTRALWSVLLACCRSGQAWLQSSSVVIWQFRIVHCNVTSKSMSGRLWIRSLIVLALHSPPVGTTRTWSSRYIQIQIRRHWTKCLVNRTPTGHSVQYIHVLLYSIKHSPKHVQNVQYQVGRIQTSHSELPTHHPASTRHDEHEISALQSCMWLQTLHPNIFWYLQEHLKAYIAANCHDGSMQYYTL